MDGLSFPFDLEVMNALVDIHVNLGHHFPINIVAMAFI